MKSKIVAIYSILSVFMMMAAPSASACAVCFGRTDSPLGKGLHWGVLALLVFIATMLAAFGAFAVYLARRSVAAELENESGTESRVDDSTPQSPIS